MRAFDPFFVHETLDPVNLVVDRRGAPLCNRSAEMPDRCGRIDAVMSREQRDDVIPHSARHCQAMQEDKRLNVCGRHAKA